MTKEEGGTRRQGDKGGKIDQAPDKWSQAKRAFGKEASFPKRRAPTLAVERKKRIVPRHTVRCFLGQILCPLGLLNFTPGAARTSRQNNSMSYKASLLQVPLLSSAGFLCPCPLVLFCDKANG